jgi:hypothetical protein
LLMASAAMNEESAVTSSSTARCCRDLPRRRVDATLLNPARPDRSQRFIRARKVDFRLRGAQNRQAFSCG